MSALPIGDLLAAKTADQLEQEIADLHRRNSELEQRLTGAIVRNAEKDRRVWAAAHRDAYEKLQFQADQRWARMLHEAKMPLDGLIHRAKNLGERPKRDKVIALADAARAIEGALEAGRKVADDTQKPLRDMAAERDRLRTLIGVAVHTLHRQFGRPYDSRTGSCDCAGCELRLDMDAPRQEEPQSADGDQVLPDGSVQPVLPGF